MSFVCAVPFIMHAVDAGTGRLRADPFWNEERSLHFNHVAFICIALQLYAMFLVKLSICCYLLALNFSRTFRAIIWLITLVVVTFNLIMPLLLQFCYCRPYYHRWHADIVPECWPKRVMEVTEYAQTASNISIDLVSRQCPGDVGLLTSLRYMLLLRLFTYARQTSRNRCVSTLESCSYWRSCEYPKRCLRGDRSDYLAAALVPQSSNS